ncbi:alpha/beta hydrolase [Pararhodobacter marinus]|uniref:Alpha/beta hydrolase n=1 Tax=Pararhodobacter marinus TaxID=2184063 RepID=A0A2U2C9T4_9RHOB|nr:alpha/beta fold hydrolase [Pararhodobacter marinus]PWE28554.1 alpha/beta hydrolase [Pararhodobacter marinus]
MTMASRRMGREDGLPALLAHCFLGHGGSWKALLDALPVPLDALVPDLPGHGRSPMPAEPGDFHDSVARALGAEIRRPSLLIGHSFGAASLLRHALHHQQDATGLVLIEPVFFAAAAGTQAYGDYRRETEAMEAALGAGRPDEAARLFLAGNPGSPDFDALPAPAQALMAVQIALVQATDAGLFGDSGQLLAPGLMARFDRPVLIVVGSETAPIFPAIQRGLAGRLARVDCAVIDGAGHMAPLSHPQAVAAVIGDWIKRQGLDRVAQGAGAPGL